MNCPQRSEMVLLKRMAKQFPELFSQERETVAVADYEADTTSLLEPALSFDSDATADLAITNALVGVGAEKQQRDIAIAGNIITRVGSAEEIAAVTGPKTRVIDAAGRSVMPGFTDSHLHLSVAMQRLKACNVEDVTSADEFKKRVAEFAREKKDEPVLSFFGLHYFDDPIIPANRCRHVLDEIVDDRPLLVYAHDLHTLWGNTKALETAGLLHEMPPFPHLVEELGLQEKIVLGKDRMPSGEVHEPEVYSFLCAPVEAHFAPSVEQRLEELHTVCLQLARLGITSVHRMALAQPAEDISFLLLLIELEQLGKLPIRVNTSCSAVADSNMLRDAVRAHAVRTLIARARKKEITAAELHDALVALLQEAGGGRHDEIEKLSQKGGAGEGHPKMETILKTSRHVRKNTHALHVRPHVERENPHRRADMPKHVSYHAKVRCDTIKIFMDGIIEKDTAFRLDKPPTKGIPEFSQQELDRLLELADKLGMQVAAHSIGDGSVHSMLDAIAKARRANGDADKKRTHRIPHRVEHIETCQETDLPRFGKEHVVTSMQPLHERPPMTLWHELVPKTEWNTAFAWKEALTHGAVLVFGSDWPIVSCDVRQGINHAVTRKPWYAGARNQGVDLEQAVAAYTTGPAFTEYCSAIRGVIKPGMLADVVVLSGNITELEQDDPSLDIDMTICDGRIVFERGDERPSP